MTEHLGEQISALLDGELTAVESEAAGSHLAACPACRDELAATGLVRGWVRALPPVGPPTPVRHLRPHRRRPARPVAALAVAAAAAAVVLLQVTPQQDPVTPKVGQLVQVHATSGGNTDPVGQVSPVAVPISFRP